MTSKNMIPRKFHTLTAVIQHDCDGFELLATADGGETAWRTWCQDGEVGVLTWDQIAPLPLREDEAADEDPWQDRWAAAMAQLRQEMDRRMSIERVSLKYLSDLRRVREAVREYVGLSTQYCVAGNPTDTTQQWDALLAINKEPMP